MESRFQGPNGTLFGNKNKKMDKHPDYTGDLELDLVYKSRSSYG